MLNLPEQQTNHRVARDNYLILKHSILNVASVNLPPVAKSWQLSMALYPKGSRDSCYSIYLQMRTFQNINLVLQLLNPYYIVYSQTLTVL